MHKRPLAVTAVFFALGILLARSLPEWVGVRHVFIVNLALISLTLLLSLKRDKGYRRNIFLLLSVISFAALLYIRSNAFPDNHISHVLGEDRLKTEMVGIIKSPALSRKPYYGKICSTYLFEVEAIKAEGRWLYITGLAHIRIETERNYGYGERLLVKGAIKIPNDKFQNPNYLTSKRSKISQFNYREYLEQQNIFALINTKESNVTILEHDYKINPILKYTYLLREKLKNQIIEKMPLENGAFLQAILLGDRSELPRHIQTAFKNSGTMHVLAISGLHIGLIACIVLYLLKILHIKREFSYILTILSLIFFALIALSRPSVVRAVVMAGVFIVGLLLGRRVDAYNTLGVAALFILIKNPKDLFNIGFQLSFLAVLSILLLSPKLMKLVKEGSDFLVKKYVYTPLAVSAAAWFGTFPLIAYYFRISTPVAVVANLFIIPALFMSVVAGLSFFLFGRVPVLGPVLIYMNNILSDAIFYLAGFFSSIKYGHFYLG